MLKIDGSQGEGGGQILRTALTLSIITRRSIQIENIRARRARPGLMPQHLQAVIAAAQISQAQVDGAELNAQKITFQPRGIFPGHYRFEIGTAGATTLLLQTIFIPLSFAHGKSAIRILGGTHVPWSPPYHMVADHWLTTITKMGYLGQSQLLQAGFYPKGGGELYAEIEPTPAIVPIHIERRGKLQRITGISAVANLDFGIAQRQKHQAEKRLLERGLRAEIAIEKLPSRFQGTMLLLFGHFENSQCCYSALGAVGKPAERVADEAVNGLIEFLDSDGALDQYISDQLILPCLFARGQSLISTSKITNHLLTNIEIIKNFIDTPISVAGKVGTSGIITVPGTDRFMPA